MNSGERLTISAYRDMEDRRFGEDERGPRATNAHRERSLFLASEFSSDEFEVKDWGDTHSEQPHELVTFIVDFVAAHQVAAGALLGGAVSSALSDVMSDGLKSSVARLWKGRSNGVVPEFIIKSDRGIDVLVTGDRITISLCKAKGDDVLSEDLPLEADASSRPEGIEGGRQDDDEGPDVA